MSHRSRQSGLNLGPDGSEARLCCSSNIFRTLLQASFISGFDGIANAGAAIALGANIALFDLLNVRSGSI